MFYSGIAHCCQT